MLKSPGCSCAGPQCWYLHHPGPWFWGGQREIVGLSRAITSHYITSHYYMILIAPPPFRKFRLKHLSRALQSDRRHGLELRPPCRHRGLSHRGTHHDAVCGVVDGGFGCGRSCSAGLGGCVCRCSGGGGGCTTPAKVPQGKRLQNNIFCRWTCPENHVS